MNKNIKMHKILSHKDISIIEIERLLSRDNAVIFVINTGHDEFQIQSLEYLTNSEKQKMFSYSKENDRRNFYIAHSIINYVFANLLKCKVKSLQYKIGEYKKQYIVNNYSYHYNISHSKNYSVVGIHNGEIGTDIEYVNRNFEFAGIMREQFSEDDIKYIGGDLRKFFKLWVAKESYLKYAGMGFYREPDSISFVNEADGYILIYDKELIKERPIFLLEEDDYILGVCVD
ncbi:MAG: 4'-phosphopantetheinyl transferase family protein [Ruminiclostridium sp.]